MSTTPTRPQGTSPGTPQLAPLPDGYGPDGRSEWLDIDWHEHLRSAAIEVERAFERPAGILWDHLQPPQIHEIPVLERMGYA